MAKKGFGTNVGETVVRSVVAGLTGYAVKCIISGIDNYVKERKDEKINKLAEEFGMTYDEANKLSKKEIKKLRKGEAVVKDEPPATTEENLIELIRGLNSRLDKIEKELGVNEKQD